MFASEIYLTMAVHILLVNFGFYSDLIEGRKLNSDPDVPLQAILEGINVMNMLTIGTTYAVLNSYF